MKYNNKGKEAIEGRRRGEGNLMESTQISKLTVILYLHFIEVYSVTSIGDKINCTGH